MSYLLFVPEMTWTAEISIYDYGQFCESTYYITAVLYIIDVYIFLQIYAFRVQHVFNGQIHIWT